MSQTTTYSTATTLTTVIPASVSYVEVADGGDVGMGSAKIDDDAGNLTIVAFKDWKVDQSSAPSGNRRLYSGFVADRKYSRATKYAVGAGREIDVSLVDGNKLLSDYVITGTDAKRPAETVTARLTWLLGSSYSPVADHGYVVYPTKSMDKADYRGQFVGDVIRDCADVVGFNYFVYWDETNAAWSLWFDNPNTSSAYASTAKISNADGDADGSSVFAPDMETTALDRDPRLLASGVYETFSAGALYRTNASTLATYGHRDVINSSYLDKTSDAAKRRGDQYLRDHNGEDDTIPCSIYVLPANVNDIRAGHLIQAKFTHFNPEGYASYSYFRVKRRTVTQPYNTDNRYRIDLELTPVIPFLCSLLSDVNQAHGTVTGSVAVESGGTVWAHGTISGWFGGPVDTPVSTIPVYNPSFANDGNDATYSDCGQQMLRNTGCVGLYWISTLDASYIICSTSGTVEVGSSHWRTYQPTSVDYWDGSAWVTGVGHWSMTGASTTLRWVFTFSTSPTTTKLRLRYVSCGTAGIAGLWGWNPLGTRLYDWTIIGAAA